jgi:hypothetical protein
MFFLTVFMVPFMAFILLGLVFILGTAGIPSSPEEQNADLLQNGGENSCSVGLISLNDVH